MSKPVPQLLKTTLLNLAFVPTLSLIAWFSPPAPLPIKVRLLIVGLEIGVAKWLFELLSASIPLFPSLVRIPYQYSPVPFHPSVQSNKSSPTSLAKLVTTKYLESTVPPNHSNPSSEPS